MEINKNVKLKIENNTLTIEGDLNADGQPSLMLNVYQGEALKEALAKGDAVEGEGKFKFKFDSGRLMFELDTDQDGVKMADIQLDLMEATDEAGDLISN